jgi:hypothetical protein
MRFSIIYNINTLYYNVVDMASEVCLAEVYYLHGELVVQLTEHEMKLNYGDFLEFTIKVKEATYEATKDLYDNK